MQDFPKKYTTKTLVHLDTIYQTSHPFTTELLTISSFPATQMIHAGHLYSMYMRDFWLKLFARDQESAFSALFHRSNVESMQYAKEFFAKKHQSLSQVGAKKLSAYLDSQTQKKTKANQKIMAAYFHEPLQYLFEDTDFSGFVQQCFQTLQDQGNILHHQTIAQWSVDLQTSIPAHQIRWVKESGNLYTIKYFVEAKGDMVPVCAVEPDLIFGDVALLVHPGDKRYKKLIGKRVLVPVVNRLIPVL